MLFYQYFGHMTIHKPLRHFIGNAYQSTYHQLERFFQKRLGNSHDASDLSQDVFAKWLNRREDTPVQESRAFLFKIANNVLIDYWHRHQKQGQLQSPMEASHLQDAVSVSDDPAEVLNHRQRLQHLYEAIETLPPRQREAFVLCRFEGLSQSDIAEKMDISVSMVEKHIAKAMLHCKRYVEHGAQNNVMHDEDQR